MFSTARADPSDSDKVRHLLHHTSGIMDYYELLKLAGWVYGDVVTKRDALWITTRNSRLNFAPGSREEYSDTNYLLLGMIVERISGQSLPDFVQSMKDVARARSGSETGPL